MVDLAALELALLDHAEALQYVAFFGLFITLGVVELWFTDKPAQHGTRWRANLTLTVLCIIALGAVPISAVMAANYAADRTMGLLNDPAVPALVAVVAGVLLRSFLSYLTHIAFHKAPWLWRIHAVHHTDTDMDVTTAVRMHPLEFVVSAALVLPCIIAFGIPVLGIILYEILDAAMAVATHTNARLPKVADRLIRLVLVTPSMHRIHHSALQAETDSNYGATFSFWDRIFGTYRATAGDSDASSSLGLEWTYRDDSHDLIRLLAMPVTGVKASPAREGVMSG